MRAHYWPFEISATQCKVRGDALPRAWEIFLGHLAWQLLVTLTFDPSRWPSVERSLASKEATWWCQQVARLVRRPVAWLVTTEQGRCGRWHAHVLLIGLPDGLGEAPEAMWRQRNGRIDVKSVNKANGAVLYTTKSAALVGEVELSDTLRRYTKISVEIPRVRLHPCDEVAA